MRGRKPKPKHLKLLDGERKDRINQNEPQPKTINLSCPRHLGKEARKYWRKEAPKLQRLGLLTEIDSAAFELLCEVYGNWKEYKAMLKETGIAIRTPNGALQLSPAAIMVNRSYDQYKKICVEFGMTPSSRSRIVVSKPPKGGGIGDLID